MTSGAWIVLMIVAASIVAYETFGQDSSDGESVGVTSSDPVTALMQAMAAFENVNPAHNNPGGVNSNGKLLSYDTLQDGWAAMQTVVLKLAQPGVSLAQFIGSYSGATGQVLTNYIASVASALGVSANTDMGNILAGSGDNDTSDP